MDFVSTIDNPLAILAGVSIDAHPPCVIESKNLCLCEIVDLLMFYLILSHGQRPDFIQFHFLLTCAEAKAAGWQI